LAGHVKTNKKEMTTGSISGKKGINPPLFALWAAMASIIMMFGAMTSAYIVRQAAGNWLEFKMPDAFFISTVLILISSGTLHVAYNAFRKGRKVMYKGMLVLSL